MPVNANVFINCPYDEQYYPLLRPLIFTLVFFQLKPRMSFESNEGERRLDKIIKMIHDSALSIHDLSRYKADQAGDYYRLNMAFELGIDYGCKECYCENNKKKKFLIMSDYPFECQKTISDLSGVDFEYHNNEILPLINIVRNWLRKNSPREVKANPERVFYFFNYFMKELDDKKVDTNFHRDNLNTMPISEYIAFIKKWFKNNRI
jgi:hypothetical protein